jgi:acyl carrier protein
MSGSIDQADLAAKVEKIWTEVLAMPAGQNDTTFFELKGDSISAVRLVSRIEDELEVFIEVGDIFEDDPSLDTLVADVVAKAAEAEAA